MKRRAFIAGLGSAATWAVTARAQQGDRVRRVGVLMSGDENDSVIKARVSAFIQSLAGLGWTEGRNVRMDLRWAGDDNNQIRAIAQELVGLQPRHHPDTHDPGDRCSPAGDADDPDRLCERGRSRRQRHRPPT